MSTRVEHADMLQAIPRLIAEGVVCDAVVTDPPYHLLPNANRWGPGQTASKPGKDGSYTRLTAGFMNQAWDGGDIAFRPETWATVATILRPGAFLVAFGGTRTYHRLACAIEDGGFVTQDCILWLYATGFPKRRDMLKPAVEMICLAYKSGGKRTMQIDECRVVTGDKVNPSGSFTRDSTMADGWSRPWMDDRDDLRARKTAAIERANSLGRWPANVCHDGSDEVLAAFAAYGESKSDGRSFMMPAYSGLGDGSAFRETAPRLHHGHSDSGSAARFFMSAKAGAQDRWGSRHPTVKPVELMKWLVALVTPPGGTCIDPFAGSGTTGVAALATGRDAILIEREATYHADILERLAHYEGGGRHSLASKARQAKPRGETPLFDRPYDETADAIGSYNDAVRAVGATIKEGAPVPAFFLSDKPEAAECDDARCPHCDKPRRHDDRGRLQVTCGSDECFRLASRTEATALAQRPWDALRDIDFGNGFAAHNLRFRPARRIVS